MLTLLAVIHVVVAITLIIFVLLQDPKGGAAGVFGGGGGGGGGMGSNTFFGATGATSFLNKATKWMAIFFALNCLALAYLTTKPSTSVLDDFVAPATESATGLEPGLEPLGSPVTDDDDFGLEE